MLSRAGFSVDIFEQAEVLGEVGAGLQLSANAMHVLDAMGLREKITRVVFEPENAVTRHYLTGKAELTMPLRGAHKSRYGQPYYHIHRADLHELLLRAVNAEGVTIHLGRRVSGVFQSDDKLRLHCGDDCFEGDALIGADGLKSAVRTALFGEDTPRFTGQVAWRGLVPAGAVPAGMIPPDANAWLGPGRHFVSYYVRGGEMINFVAVEEREAWADEDWQCKGAINDVRAAFSGWDPRIETLLGACETCHLWGLFDRNPLPRWIKGRATLLGDACHPMLPFMAQGAAMAIEDAFILAKKLSEHDVSSSLMAYEAARKPRTSLLQKISRDNAKLFHLRSPAARAIRAAKFTVASTVPAFAHGRFDRIYGEDVTKK